VIIHNTRHLVTNTINRYHSPCVVKKENVARKKHDHDAVDAPLVRTALADSATSLVFPELFFSSSNI